MRARDKSGSATSSGLGAENSGTQSPAQNQLTEVKPGSIGSTAAGQGKPPAPPADPTSAPTGNATGQDATTDRMGQVRDLANRWTQRMQEMEQAVLNGDISHADYLRENQRYEAFMSSAEAGDVDAALSAENPFSTPEGAAAAPARRDLASINAERQRAGLRPLTQETYDALPERGAQQQGYEYNTGVGMAGATMLSGEYGNERGMATAPRMSQIIASARGDMNEVRQRMQQLGATAIIDDISGMTPEQLAGNRWGQAMQQWAATDGVAARNAGATTPAHQDSGAAPVGPAAAGNGPAGNAPSPQAVPGQPAPPSTAALGPAYDPTRSGIANDGTDQFAAQNVGMPQQRGEQAVTRPVVRPGAPVAPPSPQPAQTGTGRPPGLSPTPAISASTTGAPPRGAPGSTPTVGPQSGMGRPPSGLPGSRPTVGPGTGTGRPPGLPRQTPAPTPPPVGGTPLEPRPGGGVKPGLLGPPVPIGGQSGVAPTDPPVPVSPGDKATYAPADRSQSNRNYMAMRQGASGYGQPTGAPAQPGDKGMITDTLAAGARTIQNAGNRVIGAAQHPIQALGNAARSVSNGIGNMASGAVHGAQAVAGGVQDVASSMAERLRGMFGGSPETRAQATPQNASANLTGAPQSARGAPGGGGNFNPGGGLTQSGQAAFQAAQISQNQQRSAQQAQDYIRNNNSVR